MSDTALQGYLSKHSITQTQLAERLSELRGWVVSQPQVSHWASGSIVPSREMRRYIAQATRGEVPIESW